MPIIRDRNGKVVVSSERIQPMSEVQRQMEAERKFKELQRQRALHASAAVERDPLIRERFNRKMQQAQAAPAYGQEYGDDARAAADFTGKQLYGPTWNQPQPMPTQQDIVDGKMAREREDYTSGQFQKRMEVESDMADEVGGPGGGLDFLDAPTPMAGAGQPDIAQPQMEGPQVGPMRQPRGQANIPNQRQMETAEQLREYRRQEFERKREALQQARQFKLARQIAARNQQAAMAQQQPDQLGAAQVEAARRLLNSRDPRERLAGAQLLGKVRPAGGRFQMDPTRAEIERGKLDLGHRKLDEAPGLVKARGDEAVRARQVTADSNEKIARMRIANSRDLANLHVGANKALTEYREAAKNGRATFEQKEITRRHLENAIIRTQQAIAKEKDPWWGKNENKVQAQKNMDKLIRDLNDLDSEEEKKQ